MSASFSPTESDPTDLPNWFGHSVNTITTHPNEPTNDDLFGGLFDDDKKTNNPKPKPGHISIATQDILFADDDTSNGNSSSNGGVNKAPNLSPTKARKLNSKSRHGSSKSTTGLIAPPRAKGDKPKPQKKRKSKTSKHSLASSASFTNVFGDYTGN